ncbi:MAG: MBOAT family protein [Treponema sp.]|nr:MBOAT family protein [Treponema sp.]
MLFNSYIFILLFLPLCLAGYFALNHLGKHRTAQAFLLLMSLWFYGYFNPMYLLVIAFSVLANYAAYRLLRRRKSRIVLAAGLLTDIGLLFYFKYTDFFIASVNGAFSTDFNLLHVVLPLGISFFTFQQISFLVDSWRGEVPDYGFLHYASYVCYFPQLIAGPIVTHDELIPQFMDEEKKKLDWENLAKGIYVFTLGLSKKVLLADVFGKAVDWGYSVWPDLYTAEALIVIFAYSFQIYFDFSGYCDMASGIAKMMNIDLPVNFNSPYKALTIMEFWDRWHITLTRFLTKYVYIPLGGSRKGALRTGLNILIVFFVSGFWHGAGVSFIVWGLLHGIFSVMTRRHKAFFDALHPALNFILMFVFLNVTWVFFRADTCSQALGIFRSVLNLRFREFPPELVNCFRMPEIDLVLGSRIVEGLHFSASTLRRLKGVLFFMLAFLIVLGGRNTQEKMRCFAPTKARLCSTALLMAVCICSFSGISIFLYFNF